MKQGDKQLVRIKQKLYQARECDQQFKTFGSASHRYMLLDPVSEEAVLRFESFYNVSLPQCYRSFIKNVGNAGISFMNSGAGPYFGIFPFGEQVGSLMKSPEKYLCNECRLHPGMSDQYWDDLVHRIHFDEKILDTEYDDEMGKIFGGVLPIGSQGCTFFHALIVTGEYSGRVINADMTLEKPSFVPQNTFLDWYEQWLNGILSDQLIHNPATLFGYHG